MKDLRAKLDCYLFMHFIDMHGSWALCLCSAVCKRIPTSAERISAAKINLLTEGRDGKVAAGSQVLRVTKSPPRRLPIPSA